MNKTGTIEDYFNSIPVSPTNTYVVVAVVDNHHTQIACRGTREKCMDKFLELASPEISPPEGIVGYYVTSVEDFIQDAESLSIH